MEEKEKRTEIDDLLDFEAPSAPAAESDVESVEVPLKEETVEALPAEESAPAEEIEAEESAPVEEAPTYGAPQPLFEDIIPAGFTLDERKRAENREKAEREAAARAEREEKEAAAAAKKAEKEAAKEAKKTAKEEKKRAKTAALIAAVEADAEKKARKEIERETGETYDPPAPEAPAAPATPEVVVAAAAAPVVAATAPETPAASAPAPSSTTSSASREPRQYSKYEKKLRKQYKMNKDLLLSENDVIPGFVIAKGENVIRSYRCLATAKGDGTLCLTNKRLLINAGERSEVSIDKVTGIKFSKYSNFSFLKFLFWLIFFGLGAFMLILPTFRSGMNIPMITGDSWKDWFTYLFYACGAVSVVISIPLFFTMLKKTFYFYVFAREEAPFLECKSGSYAKREKKGKVYKYMVAKAGKESEKAARELGALIIEAKEGRYDF